MSELKNVRFHETNDVILFQDLNTFIGYDVHQRHPYAGKKMTRICQSGKISSVHILPNGSLLEIRYGQKYPSHRRQFPSFNNWINFVRQN